MKEFYFIRHGQTDHNISEGNLKGDHPDDISINATGRMQAEAIEPLIATLPVHAICASPLARVQETKKIIAKRLIVEHHLFADLGECNAKIWFEMIQLGMFAPPPTSGDAFAFIQRVKRGIDSALALPGTPLIVAHGGVHWALCSLLGIQEHPWAIGNCVPVHFYRSLEGQWKADMMMEIINQM